MTGEWKQVPGMRGVRVARIEDGERDGADDVARAAGAGDVSRLAAQPSHSLLRLTIEPGSEVQPLGDVHAVNLHVQDGALRITVSAGQASVGVASGAPVRSADADGTVVCARGMCRLAVDTAVILGPGNSFAIRDGVMHMEAVGDRPAELQMSVIRSDPKTEPRDADDSGPVTMNLCWICPFT